MNQSAASNREIDQAEGEGIDFPAKKHCVPPTGVQRVVCRFLRGKIDEAAGGSIQKLPVNKPCRPPVTVRRRVQKPPEVFMPRYRDPDLYVYKEVTPEKKSCKFTHADVDAIMHHSADLMYEAEREAEKRGYTQGEFQLCRGFLYKRKFESSLEPLSLEYRHFKMYLDQIRDTRGYGLTVFRSNAVDDTERDFPHNLVCILHKWKRDPWAQQYVKKMEEMVLAKIEEKMGKPYKCARLVNLVMCNIIRLVTFHVHEEGAAPAAAQPPETAEAYFTIPPIAPILEHIKLHECKIRKGEKVLFSTALIRATTPPRV